MLNPNSGLDRSRRQRERLTGASRGLTRQQLLGSLLIFLLIVVAWITIAIRLHS